MHGLRPAFFVLLNFVLTVWATRGVQERIARQSYITLCPDMLTLEGPSSVRTFIVHLFFQERPSCT
jgi:hypothetical protein